MHWLVLAVVVLAAPVDTDHDGIPDVDDRCPTQPETKNGFDDEDGCPDIACVKVSPGPIEIRDRILFGKRQSTVQKAAMPLVDYVAATIVGTPELHRVAVVGHVSKEEPIALARARVRTIVDLVTSKGVPADRLVMDVSGARTHGRARDAERFVEFRVVERGYD